MFIKRSLLSALLSLAVAPLVLASSFSGGSGSGTSVTTPSSRLPNIIFIMIDEIGREQYPQLGSPYAASAGQQSFTNSTTGQNEFPLQTAADFPNLDKLLLNGINFTGMWAGKYCGATRYMLATGNPGTFGEDFASGSLRSSPMRHVTTTTGAAYNIAHWGKNALECGPSVTCGTGGMPPFGLDHTNDVPTGGAIGGGTTQWAAGYFGESGFLSIPAVDATSAAQLWSPTVNGVPNTPVMFELDVGLLLSKRHVQPDQSATGLSYAELNWFTNQTSKPFIMTYSPGTAHGISGMTCVHERTANGKYAVPTSGYQALPFGSHVGGSAQPVGPTPNYGAATNPTFAATEGDGQRGWDRIWYDCQMTKLRRIDDQIGDLIDWLGPHGLAHTLIIFTGDNGTPNDQIANRTGAWVPNAATIEPTPSPPVLMDMTVLNGSDAPVANALLRSGKGQHTETGLNVAFVVAYGNIPQSLRNTSSATRLTFADVAETIVQLVSPNSTGTGYYPEGRDFTPLIYGTATDQDRLFGTDVTVMSDGTTGNGVAGASAVMNKDVSGNIYRMYKPPVALGFCDYIQDLSRADFETNLRGPSASRPGGVPAWDDAEVAAAITAMDTALTAVSPAADPTLWSPDGC